MYVSTVGKQIEREEYFFIVVIKAHCGVSLFDTHKILQSTKISENTPKIQNCHTKNALEPEKHKNLNLRHVKTRNVASNWKMCLFLGSFSMVSGRQPVLLLPLHIHNSSHIQYTQQK